MRCARCRHENPAGANFCKACGAKLDRVCPTCGHVNPPGSRFCNECGGDLAPPLCRAPKRRSASPQSYTPRQLAERILAEQATVDQPQGELHRRLPHLQGAEFIYQRPAFPEPGYTFKHALAQEMACNSLLLERRKALHEQVAQASEALFHDRPEEHDSELAHHYRRSGNTAQAVDYLQRAGQQAAQRSAYNEALAQLTAALDLLATLSEGQERLQQELLIQTALGPALSVAKGYAAPEGERSFTHRELCQRVGDAPQLGLVLWGLHRFYFMRAEHQTAQELTGPLLRLAQHDPAPSSLLAAHTALGTALWVQGHPTAARAHLEPEMPGVEAQQRRALAFRYGVDP
jgi:tetratricopeptide (TPR) repeat protein